MKVTLKDIAEDTGFSISTISRVLNGSNKISTDTREKVLSSAVKLGYDMTENGESKSKKQLNIALVATGFHQGEFYSCYFHGLNRSSAQNKAQLFLAAVGDHEEDLLQVLKNLSTEHFDGIVLFVSELLRTDYEKIESVLPKNFPVISNSLIENPVFPTVTFDSYSGGYMAAKHLHERGYRKAGIISGPAERSETRFRRNGFSDYIYQQHDMDLVWFCNGDFTIESGVSAFQKYQNEENKPDAVFASNDSMAKGFLHSAQRNDVKIPEEVALIGYDDLPQNSFTYPTISSIHTDYAQLGDETIKALLERVFNKDLKSNLLSFVPVSVSQREST